MTIPHPFDAYTPLANFLIAFVVSCGVSWLIFRNCGADMRKGQPTRRWDLRALGNFARAFALVWVALTLLVLYGLWELAWEFGPSLGGEDLRWHVLALVGLLTALAGLVGTPLALMRVMATERQVTTAEQGLITDRINKAVEGLGAEKIVKVRERRVIYKLDGETREMFTDRIADWRKDLPHGAEDAKACAPKGLDRTVPNIEVRVGAIYALERIAQDSDRDHVQIMEILTAYVRENAPAAEASAVSLSENRSPPDGRKTPVFSAADTREKAKDHPPAEIGGPRAVWVSGLKARTDIQTALAVIGRRQARQIELERRAPSFGEGGYRLDLRGCNLQGLNLTDAKLSGARLPGVRMEGALLPGADLRGANLRDARMYRSALRAASLTGADLTGAWLDWSDLIDAVASDARLEDCRLEGADLGDAVLEGTWLVGCKLDAETLFRPRSLRAAAVKGVDFTVLDMTMHDVARLGALLGGALGDATTKLPNGMSKPDHWPDSSMTRVAFKSLWRDWQRSIGYRPATTG